MTAARQPAATRSIPARTGRSTPAFSTGLMTSVSKTPTGFWRPTSSNLNCPPGSPAAATEQQRRDIAAEGPGEVCFRDVGRHAHRLMAEFTDIEALDFDL